MTSPPFPFFMDGPCRDLGYQNTRDSPRGTEHKRFLEQLWARFYPLADRHFREDACHHFLERFWEMYLAVTLIDNGIDLHRHGDEGPEFYAFVEGRRVWFEAIAPGPGTGPDYVPDLVPGEGGYVPIEKILLRYTSAFDEKRRKYDEAVKQHIISSDDAYVIAINGCGIRHALMNDSMPYFVQAFLPFGPYTVSVDTTTFEIKDAFYQYRAAVSKMSGSSVSTRSFLDEQSSFCPAILHSAVDCANHPARFGGISLCSTILDRGALFFLTYSNGAGSSRLKMTYCINRGLTRRLIVNAHECGRLVGDFLSCFVVCL